MSKKEIILESFPEDLIAFADGFDDAILGVCDDDLNNIRVIYSSKQSLQIIYNEINPSDVKAEDGQSNEDALWEMSMEHFEFNVKGSKGKGFPIWCNDFNINIEN